MYFGIPGQIRQKRLYQLAKDFDVYLHKKINFTHHFFTEILQRFCELVIFGTLGMTSNADEILYS